MKKQVWIKIIILSALLMPTNLIYGEEVKVSTETTSQDVEHTVSSSQSLVPSDLDISMNETMTTSSSTELAEPSDEKKQKISEEADQTNDTVTPTDKDEQQNQNEYGEAITPTNLRVYKNNWDIWDMPYEKGLAKSVANTKSYYLSEVTITRKAVTNSATYVLISHEVDNTLVPIGWLNENGVDLLEFGEAVVPEEARIFKKNWDIWDIPYRKGYSRSLRKSTSFYKQKVVIKRRIIQKNAIYVLISFGNQELGWINEKGLGPVLDGQSISPTKVRIYKNNWDIWDSPYEKGVSTSINKTTNFYKQEVMISRRAKIGSRDYVLISYNNQEIGWLNESGVGPLDEFYSENGKLIENTYLYIDKNNWDIWEKPYTKGVKSVANTSSYLHDKILITRLAKTASGTYAKIWAHRGGKYNFIGWYNQAGLAETIPSVNMVSGELIPNTYGKLIKSNWTIWESPFKPGIRSVGNTSNYLNQTLLFTRKAKTLSGTYYKMWSKVNGKYTYIGWVTEKGLQFDSQKMKKVQSMLSKKYNSANYGIQVTSLIDGTTAGINSNRRFTAASTGKLPAIYYTQKKISTGKISPKSRFVYTDRINQMPLSYGRGGAGVLQGQKQGTYFALETILNWTIKYSDNQGTNFIAYYAADKYDSKMRNEISSIIGRTWDSPFSITAKENALLMEAIYKQGGQSIGYLQNTIFDDQRIPKYLPVKVAHKIGDVEDKRHDVAIVYAKEPYILSVMTKNYTSYETISKISKDVYEILK